MLPFLEQLEDRDAPSGFPNPQPITTPPPPGRQEAAITVIENTKETVVNLDVLFSQVPNLQVQDGLQFKLLCNTNPGLVITDMSADDLILQYGLGSWGNATLTVGATDADGVSEQESILVTVIPLTPTPQMTRMS